VAGHLAAPVQHQHGAVLGHRQAGRRGVRDVVRHEPHLLRVEAGQGGGEELRRPAGVVDAQVVPRVVEAQRGGVAGQARVEGVRHRVEVTRAQAGLLKTPGGGQLGQLPRGERNGTLAVLAPAEPLLLRSRHHLTVDDQGGGRIVEDRVDTQNSHGDAHTPVVAHLLA
jgi:hypothetical protein